MSNQTKAKKIPELPVATHLQMVKTKVADAVLASAAAPTFFPAHEILIGKENSMKFVDGGTRDLAKKSRFVPFFFSGSVVVVGSICSLHEMLLSFHGEC